MAYVNVYKSDQKKALKRFARARELSNKADEDKAWKDYKEAEATVDWAVGQQIVEDAQKLDLEIPGYLDKAAWRNDESFRAPILTAASRLALRRLIDEEKARRFEVKTLWVTKIILPLAGVFVGIIGALTGLVAVLQHKK